MTHVMNGTHSVQRLECAIKYRQVLIEKSWSTFDGAVVIDVFDNSFHRRIVISQFLQRGRHRVVHNLYRPATHEFLVLDERQVRFHTGGIAVHHEPDRAGGRKYGSLRIAISVQFSKI